MWLILEPDLDIFLHLRRRQHPSSATQLGIRYRLSSTTERGNAVHDEFLQLLESCSSELERGIAGRYGKYERHLIELALVVGSMDDSASVVEREVGVEESEIFNLRTPVP